jgi:hypothetical protein
LPSVYQLYLGSLSSVLNVSLPVVNLKNEEFNFSLAASYDNLNVVSISAEFILDQLTKDCLLSFNEVNCWKILVFLRETDETRRRELQDFHAQSMIKKILIENPVWAKEHFPSSLSLFTSSQSNEILQECDYSLVGKSLQFSSRTIVTIFAGRANRLFLLMKYWNTALDHNIIQEVHLWDYCKNASDRDFLYSLSNPTKGIFIRTKYTNRLAWTDYYRYYGEYGKRHPNDIIIKCDDDITFVDIFKLPYFISVLQREETDESVVDGVLFANIINNGVAAHYQQTLWNILPKAAIDEEIKVTAKRSRILAEENRFKASDIDGEMEYPIDGLCGSLWSSGRKATIVHNYFIKNWESIIRPHRSTTSSSLIYPLRQTNDTSLSVESFQQKQQ